MTKLMLFLITLGINSHIYSQKPVIDTAVLKSFRWPTADFPDITNDGKYALYTIKNMPAGSNTLVICAIDGNWQRQYIDVERGWFTQDNKQLVFKNSNDSLCILDLEEKRDSWVPGVISYVLVDKEEKGKCLAYLKRNPEGELMVRSLQNDKEIHFSGVMDYTFNTCGTVLVWQKKGVNGSTSNTLQWEDLLSGKGVEIWKGQNSFQYVFDESGSQLAFITEEMKDLHKGKELWYYKEGMDSARLQVSEKSPGLDSSLTVDGIAPLFSQDGNRIFFRLIEKRLHTPPPGSVLVDVWNYKDLEMQSSQLQNMTRLRSFVAVSDLRKDRLIQLQGFKEDIVIDHSNKDDQAIIYRTTGSEGWWNKSDTSIIYLISTIDGTRKVIKTKLSCTPYSGLFSFSPGGRWIVFFDRNSKSWYSFEKATEIIRNISKAIPYPVYNDHTIDHPAVPPYITLEPVGIGGWLKEDKGLLIYDNYDIWRIDPAGITKPICITHKYGRRQYLKFRIAREGVKEDSLLITEDTLLLSAFNTQTKFNGFFRQVISSMNAPQLLTMGPWVMYAKSSQLLEFSSATSSWLIKAKSANVWIVSRRSPTESLNFYFTRNFNVYRPISNIQPQKAYNWLTTELIHWKTLDGKISSGILYKPENFNPKKQYPVILNYYERRSDNLYDYPLPEFSGAEINIPWFVSREYLVFIPDIYYKIGHAGESVVNYVVSAANHLAMLPYVDGRRLGLDGHSFGGFETNYLVTHTHLFAAAAEAAGSSNFISGYGGLKAGTNYTGISDQLYYEAWQGRVGATLWEQPKLYLENSPVLYANQVTTPLLMMHNKKDGAVNFSQGIEFFTALRRLGKRVWMLQYDNGAHALGGDKEALDYTIRLEQFYNHYLKGAFPPKWMTEVIPARSKGIITGYELEKIMVKP